VLFVAAVVCKGIIEYLIAPWFDKWEKSGSEPVVVEQVLRLVTAVLGIAAVWQLDLQFFRTAFGVELLSPWLDLGVTGVAIGRGSNYMHDLIGSLRHQL